MYSPRLHRISVAIVLIKISFGMLVRSACAGNAAATNMGMTKVKSAPNAFG